MDVMTMLIDTADEIYNLVDLIEKYKKHIKSDITHDYFLVVED